MERTKGWAGIWRRRENSFELSCLEIVRCNQVPVNLSVDSEKHALPNATLDPPLSCCGGRGDLT